MKYKIYGETLPAVSLILSRGESIYSQSGGMTWMSDGFDMETGVKGGMMKGLGRMLTGESLFMVTYTCTRDDAEITFASTFPGSIIAFQLDGTRELVCQKSAFLCATPGVELDASINHVKAGLFGGEGLLMQRISGSGVVFLELDGTVVEKALAYNECLKVDTGNVAAYDGSVTFSAETVRGLKNVVFGGEGLFLSTLRGPGKVYLQTMNLPSFARRILPYIPKRQD